MAQDIPPTGDAQTEKEKRPATAPDHVLDVPSTMQPVQPHQKYLPGAAVRYVAVFSSAVALVFAFSLVFATTRWFHEHCVRDMSNIGYGLHAAHLNCEVVLYGDSSALTGLDPSIVQQMTGLKTCNIAEGESIQYLVGSDEVLQEYLRQNTPPRYLLGTWTPAALRPTVEPFQNYFPEGIVYGLQSSQRWKLILQMLIRPRLAAPFSSFSFSRILDALEVKAMRQPLISTDDGVEREVRVGQWMYPLPPETRCRNAQWPSILGPIQAWPQSVQTFRERYSTPQTKVIIDVSPAADCNPSGEHFAQMNAGLHDNAFERVPIRFFNDSDVHFSPEGSRYISEVAARQILAAIASRLTASTSDPSPGSTQRKDTPSRPALSKR